MKQISPSLILGALLVTAAAARSSCPPQLPTSFPSPRNVSSDIEFVGSQGRHFVIHENDTLLNDDDTAPSTVNGNPDKIVGGTLSTGDLNNYIVQLFYNNGFFCTGSVLNKKYILTAAHCNPGSATGIDVWYWTESQNDWLTKRTVRRLIPHPKYDDDDVVNDIMLMQIRGTAPSSANFITVNHRRNLPRKNAIARTAGFGVTREGGFTDLSLRQVDIPCRSKKSCAELAGGYDHALHICAAYKCGGCDSCQGDSGGPIFQFDSNGYVYQIGIVSYGNGCARPINPGVYARVSKYRRWIKRKIKNTGMFVGGRVPQKRVAEDACP